MKTKCVLFWMLLGCVSLFSTPLEELNPEAAEEKAVADEQTEEADKEAEEKKKEEEEKAKKKARLDKIGKLKFDRTIRNVLEAWAPKDEVEEEEKEGADDEEKEEEEPDPFDESLKQFTDDVALGDWAAAKAFIAGLEEKEADAAFEKMLSSLRSATPAVVPKLDPVFMSQVQRMRVERQQPARNAFSFDDIFGIIDCAPGEWEDDLISSLGTIVRSSLEAGNVVERLVVRFEKEEPLDKRDLAKLMKAANRLTEMGRFLPDLDTAIEESDHEALNLLSDYFYALYGEEQESEHLEQAWKVTQAVLASAEVGPEEKETALKQAVDLSVRVSEELGQRWLEESFTSHPERGMEVLRVIGSAPSYNIQRRPTDTTTRTRALRLQSTAVEALLKVSPERAKEWRHTVNLLALNWLREADFSRTYDSTSSRSSSMQRDRYGNYYYSQQQSSYVRNRVQPIKTGDVLEIKPSDEWIALLDESLVPKLDKLFAQLYLKVNEEDEAFPYIEKVAKTYPEMGEDLVNEFLRVWTRNHDPNSSRNRSKLLRLLLWIRAESGNDSVDPIEAGAESR